MMPPIQIWGELPRIHLLGTSVNKAAPSLAAPVFEAVSVELKIREVEALEERRRGSS
jgi:hypothetical protein